MLGEYELAIKEGATVVCVGQAKFGNTTFTRHPLLTGS